jgi:hypothetical protein
MPAGRGKERQGGARPRNAGHGKAGFLFHGDTRMKFDPDIVIGFVCLLGFAAVVAAIAIVANS